MHLITRKAGSQRTSAPVGVVFEPNYAGQGGFEFLTLVGEDGKYYTLHFEGLEEVRALLSHAHIVWANYRTEEEKKALKERYGIDV